MAKVLELTGEMPAIELAEDGGRLHMVTFEQPSGASVSLRYTDLTGIRFHSPDDGLKLYFATATVLVRGCNLLPVWRAFRSRRVMLLRPGGAQGPGGDEPRIDSITITRTPRQKK